MNSRFKKVILLAIEGELLATHSINQTDITTYWQSIFKMLDETINEQGFKLQVIALTDNTKEGQQPNIHLISNHVRTLCLDPKKPRARIITEAVRNSKTLLNYCVYLSHKTEALSHCKSYRIHTIDTNKITSSSYTHYKFSQNTNQQYEQLTHELIQVTQSILQQSHPADEAKNKLLSERERIVNAPFYVADNINRWYQKNRELYIVGKIYKQTQMPHPYEMKHNNNIEHLLNQLEDNNLLVMPNIECAVLYAQAKSSNQQLPVIYKVEINDLSKTSRLLYLKFRVHFNKPKPNDILDTKSLAVRTTKQNLTLLSILVPDTTLESNTRYQELLLSQQSTDRLTL